MKEQVKWLSNISHNLSQITFANNIDPDERPEYRRALSSLPSMIGSANVVLVEKENYGMSYGLFDYVYQMYRDAFSYYIFIEDDRVFVLGNFDSKLVKLYEHIPQCGYLCGLVEDRNRVIPFASQGSGIVSSAALKKVCDKFGSLGHNPSRKNAANYDANETEGQVKFGQYFSMAGCKLHDIRGYYNIPYWDAYRGKSFWYTGEATDDVPILAMPIQLLHSPEFCRKYSITMTDIQKR